MSSQSDWISIWKVMKALVEEFNFIYYNSTIYE